MPQEKLKPSTCTAALAAHMKSHPDYRVVSYGGSRYHFLFGARGMRLAKKVGLTPLNSIAKISAAVKATGKADVEAAGREVLDAMPLDDLVLTYAEVIWCGLVPFYPDMPLDTVDAYLTPGSLAEAQAIVVAVIGGAAEADIVEAAEGTPVGN